MGNMIKYDQWWSYHESAYIPTIAPYKHLGIPTNPSWNGDVTVSACFSPPAPWDSSPLCGSPYHPTPSSFCCFAVSPGHNRNNWEATYKDTIMSYRHIHIYRVVNQQKGVKVCVNKCKSNHSKPWLLILTNRNIEKKQPTDVAESPLDGWLSESPVHWWSQWSRRISSPSAMSHRKSKDFLDSNSTSNFWANPITKYHLIHEITIKDISIYIYR